MEGIVPEQSSWDRDLQVRIANQVDTIVKSFAAQHQKIIVVPDSDGGVAYMYAEGQLLVQDRYVNDVLQIFNPGQEINSENPGRKNNSELVRHIVPGVSLLTQSKKPNVKQPTVAVALETIDQELGPGIATPNHVFTVAPSGPCPATEPEEVYYGIEPYPPVCLENGGAGVLVYIADTGLLQDAEVDHPWLHGVTRALRPDGTLQDPDPAGILLNGTTTIPHYAGHGTFVAGVVRCMAPEADVMVSNAFKVAGSSLESDFVVDLEQALALGVDVFHLSISTTTRHDLSSLGFDGFLGRLRQYQGVVCVVAAGNNGNRKPSWPAATPGMISVGALGADWNGRAKFSNYGHWVKVYAPGRDLINAYATGPYKCGDYPYKNQVRNFYGMARWSGTSFSTPIVTGLVAARMSRTGETGEEAAAALLAEARSHAIPGVGPVLLPCGNHCGGAPQRSGRACCRDAGTCGHDACR
jgi:hypothetical protein